MSFCGLTKGISSNMCVRVKIDKLSFEPFCLWILFQNASSHFASDCFICVVVILCVSKSMSEVLYDDF